MCKKEKTLYVTKFYNKRIYIRSLDSKDCLWLFASGHSPSLESGVLFAAPQLVPRVRTSKELVGTDCTDGETESVRSGLLL